MGLNATHIRVVIHYKPPTSIENYFQETGRAGKDCLPSKFCTLTIQTFENKQELNKVSSITVKNDSRCLREVMLKTFGCQKS